MVFCYLLRCDVCVLEISILNKKCLQKYQKVFNSKKYPVYLDLVGVEFGGLAEWILLSADSFTRFAGTFNFLEGFPEFLEGGMVSRMEPEPF